MRPRSHLVDVKLGRGVEERGGCGGRRGGGDRCGGSLLVLGGGRRGLGLARRGSLCGWNRGPVRG